MVEVKISYETLFDILRREKQREELQELIPTFYADVSAYLSQKEMLLYDSAKSPFGISEQEELKIQLTNIKRILTELYDRRENKIIRLAQDRSRSAAILQTSTILPEESGFFDTLVRLFKDQRRGIFSRRQEVRKPDGHPEHAVGTITSSHAAAVEEAPSAMAVSNREEGMATGEIPTQGVVKASVASIEKKTIRFLAATSKFVGREMEVYGPFKADDVAELPKPIADLLIRKGRAEDMPLQTNT